MKNNRNLCDVCGKNQAHIHIVEMTPKGRIERNLCEECADKEGLMAGGDNFSFSFTNFLRNIIPVAFDDTVENTDAVCQNCGLSYEDVRHNGQFGCPVCYVAFKDKISGILKVVQGKAESHIGKSPKNLKRLSPARELEKLKRSLKIAIEEEEYERAAKLRDRIAELEGKVGNKSAAS